MAKDGFDRLLADLAEHIGMTELKFDENMFCHITVDDQFPVAMRRDDSTNQLILLSELASKLPEEFDRATLEGLLALGLGPLREHGIGMGYEPSTKHLILHQCLPLNELNLERLKSTLGAFFETTKHWRAELEKMPAPRRKEEKTSSPIVHGFL